MTEKTRKWQARKKNVKNDSVYRAAECVVGQVEALEAGEAEAEARAELSPEAVVGQVEVGEEPQAAEPRGQVA
jgi:hypothetical protein